MIGKLLNLQARLDVQMIAGVTALKVEIDVTNIARSTCFLRFEACCDLDCDGRISHAAGAGDEGYDDGPPMPRGDLAPRQVARSDDVENFLGLPVGRDPVGALGADEPFVIARGDLIADQNKKNSLVVLRRDRDQIVYICRVEL